MGCMVVLAATPITEIPTHCHQNININKRAQRHTENRDGGGDWKRESSKDATQTNLCYCGSAVFFFFFFRCFFCRQKSWHQHVLTHSVTYSHKQWWNNAVAKVHRTESKCFFLSLYPDSLIHFTYAYALPYRSNSLTHFCVAFFRFHFYVFLQRNSFVCVSFCHFNLLFLNMTCTEQLYIPSNCLNRENRNEIKSAHTQNTYSYCKKTKQNRNKKLMIFFSSSIAASLIKFPAQKG